MSPSADHDGFQEHRLWLISELKRLNDEFRAFVEKYDRGRREDLIAAARTAKDLAVLKFQAAVWGAAAGIAFGSITTVLVTLLLRTVLK